jgi:hypothetical protein
MMILMNLMKFKWLPNKRFNSDGYSSSMRKGLAKARRRLSANR